jgi:hypothetical protein
MSTGKTYGLEITNASNVSKKHENNQLFSMATLTGAVKATSAMR